MGVTVINDSNKRSLSTRLWRPSVHNAEFRGVRDYPQFDDAEMEAVLVAARDGGGRTMYLCDLEFMSNGEAEDMLKGLRYFVVVEHKKADNFENAKSTAKGRAKKAVYAPDPKLPTVERLLAWLDRFNVGWFRFVRI